MIDAFLPPLLTVPLSRHARLAVKRGETVEEGQLLGTGEKGNVHSPVPGKVEGIVKMSLADGTRGWCVKIITGGTFKYLGKRRESEMRGTLSSKGVLNTFGHTPTVLETRKTNILVVLLCDEDPSVKTTAMLSVSLAEEVKQGAQIVANATLSGKIVFVGEENMRALYVDDDANEKVQFVSSSFKRYPSTYKMALKQCVSDMDNAENDALFIDAATALMARDAGKFDTPSMTSYVYFDGECLRTHGLLRVRVGTPIHNVVEQCGGFIKKCNAVIVNGFMLGSSAELDSPIDKWVKSVTFVPHGILHNQEEGECTSCGNCRDVCPEHLLPDLIFDGLGGGDAARCSGCGLCNSVCPARLPLVQGIFRDESGEDKKSGVIITKSAETTGVAVATHRGEKK